MNKKATITLKTLYSNVLRLLLITISILIVQHQLMAQQTAHKAFLDEEGRVFTKEIQLTGYDRQQAPKMEQVSPWPIKVPAHPNFKSFRGVTLADIDGDGVDDILIAASNKLHVFKGNGDMIWSFTLTGTATYPPSVADVTGDGNLEIVQLTGGIPNNGRAYLFNAQGEVMTGWPLNFNNQWILSAPALADIDGDGQMEIVFGIRTVNELHVVKADGSPMNENWPIVLSGIPAFTPSIGDLDGNGQLDIIASASNGTLYAFDLNGQNKPGFPVQAPSTGFSYQSPLLVDFDDNGTLSIVGATHGNLPEYYVREHDGAYRTGWPVSVPNNDWTYHPPTVVDINDDGNYEVFTAKPVSDFPLPMLFGFDDEGEMLEHFPIEKAGGLEGFLSVADIDGDGTLDLIFGSNLMVEGEGFIHAYKTDGSGEIEGFPLRPDGFTFMNGANLGDVTGDGMLNIVALSYELNFSPNDSTLINVWDMGIPIEQADIRFGTYKGSNTRSGLIGVQEPAPDPDVITHVEDFDNIIVPYGTPQEELDLPETVIVWLNDDENQAAELSVVWEAGDPEYDETTPGIYPFIGNISLQAGIVNPDNLTASIHVEVEEGPEWSFIRLVNASNDLANVQIKLNGEVLLADFPTGMTSDTLFVLMNEMHTLEVISADNGDVFLSHEFILENVPPYEYYDQEDGLLIILAGMIDEGGAEEYGLGVFTRRTTTLATDTDAFIMSFFDAYANPEAETTYEVISLGENDEWLGSDLSEIYFGSFTSGLMHADRYFIVDLQIEIDDESINYQNKLDLGKYFGWGSPGILVIILNYHPDSDMEGSLPYFLLLPPLPGGGMFQVPDVIITNVGDLTGNGRSTFGSLYPNPAKNKVSVEFEAFATGDATITLYDVTGRSIQTIWHRVSSAGSVGVDIDLQGINPGMYILRALLNDQQFAAPLMVR